MEPGTDTALGRLALLAEASLYGVDLVSIAEEHPGGAKTLDWDVLARAVAEKRPQSEQTPSDLQDDTGGKR